MMKKNGFSRCAEMYIGRLRKEGRYSTAHVYENALFSFMRVLWYLYCVIRTNNSRTLTVLWAVSL